MNNYYAVVRSPNYLEHYGILGMKWGVRRFQNPDGSLTEEGRKRYGDILTKDQMNNMVKSYNTMHGTHKTITKNTLFKTKDGATYDHKGRRVNAETNVEDPTESNSEVKKTDTRHKKVSDMTDEELRAINNRMQAELDYRDKYAKLNAKKPNMAQQLVNNLKEDLVRDIPAGISAAVKNYIQNSGKSDGNDDSKGSDSNSKPKEKDKQTKTVGVDPSKLGDKALESYNTRKAAEIRAMELRDSENKYYEARVNDLLSAYGSESVEDVMRQMDEAIPDHWTKPESKKK